MKESQGYDQLYSRCSDWSDNRGSDRISGQMQWQRLNYHVQPMDRGSYRCIFGDLYCKEINDRTHRII
jgi:hypothetical protein